MGESEKMRQGYGIVVDEQAWAWIDTDKESVLLLRVKGRQLTDEVTETRPEEAAFIRELCSVKPGAGPVFHASIEGDEAKVGPIDVDADLLGMILGMYEGETLTWRPRARWITAHTSDGTLVAYWKLPAGLAVSTVFCVRFEGHIWFVNARGAQRVHLGTDETTLKELTQVPEVIIQRMVDLIATSKDGPACEVRRGDRDGLSRVGEAIVTSDALFMLESVWADITWRAGVMPLVDGKSVAAVVAWREDEGAVGFLLAVKSPFAAATPAETSGS